MSFRSGRTAADRYACPFYVVLLVASVIMTTVSTLVFKYKVDGRMVKRLNERSVALQKS